MALFSNLLGSKRQEREIATIIVQLLLLIKNSEERIGEGAFVGVLRNHTMLSYLNESTGHGGKSCVFGFGDQLEGFQFSSEHEDGKLSVTIFGNEAYCGFWLHSSPATEYLAAYCEDTPTRAATAAAKKSKVVFVKDLGARDFSNLI